MPVAAGGTARTAGRGGFELTVPEWEEQKKGGGESGGGGRRGSEALPAVLAGRARLRRPGPGEDGPRRRARDAAREVLVRGRQGEDGRVAAPIIAAGG